mmetsp:Transcript_13677/g.30182  ORF Transcript_13677/g.30182 Transcript_13677/m.30182 type:complete len:227 (-) Transcript_13677:2068-2748(-)
MSPPSADAISTVAFSGASSTSYGIASCAIYGSPPPLQSSQSPLVVPPLPPLTSTLGRSHSSPPEDVSFAPSGQSLHKGISVTSEHLGATSVDHVSLQPSSASSSVSLSYFMTPPSLVPAQGKLFSAAVVYLAIVHNIPSIHIPPPLPFHHSSLQQNQWTSSWVPLLCPCQPRLKMQHHIPCFFSLPPLLCPKCPICILQYIIFLQWQRLLLPPSTLPPPLLPWILP